MSYVAREPDTRKGDIENHIFNAVSSSGINKNNRLYAVSLFHVINEFSFFFRIYIAFIRNFLTVLLLEILYRVSHRLC